MAGDLQTLAGKTAQQSGYSRQKVRPSVNPTDFPASPIRSGWVTADNAEKIA